jgi:hypothetical protein
MLAIAEFQLRIFDNLLTQMCRFDLEQQGDRLRQIIFDLRVDGEAHRRGTFRTWNGAPPVP